MAIRRHRPSVRAILPRLTPDPSYEQYEEVREKASQLSRRFVDQRDLDRMEDVVRHHGYDWCTAVIGYRFAGIAYVPSTEAWMLVVADERGLDPELPATVVESRRTFDSQRDEDKKSREGVQARERQRWELAAGGCPVKITVHSNLKRGQMRELRHAVPTEDVVSGRSRVHQAGRALCETPDRENPRRLGDALEEGTAATCRSCVKYVGVIRRVSDPAPPTPAEQDLLRLIASGVVFTLRHARGQATIRVTTERSRGAGGALGRSVDTAVKKLKVKGWVSSDAEHSATQTGHYGHRWRLTESGTAALEG